MSEELKNKEEMNNAAENCCCDETSQCCTPAPEACCTEEAASCCTPEAETCCTDESCCTPEGEACCSEVGDEMMDMGALLDKYGDGNDEVTKGKVIEGVIVSKAAEGWLIDVGYKCEGFLPQREWSHHVLVDGDEEPKVGDTVQVVVTSMRDGEEAQLLVSRWRCEFDRRWAELESVLSEDKPIKVRGLRKVKGGLIVDCCSLEGFIPISHLAAEGRGVNPSRFEEEEFEVCLLEKDKRKRRLVLSRRSLLDADLDARRAKFYEEVHEGDVLDGVVSSLTSFGAFVNVGPIDGLVHVSEISWQRRSKARDTLKKGDEVKVKVIGIDQENNKISLSIRQVMGDPWETVTERWAKDQRTTGVVTNVTDFGAFVEVEPGIEGLVHIGDLSWSRVKHPRDVVRKGQEVEVIVLDIDTDRRRMSLGYKQLNDPWSDIETRYAKGQDVNVKVVRLADFGAFVELEEGVEGLIHISQLSTQRVEKPRDVLTEGQEVTARILEVNPEGRRIRLSIRALEGGDEPRAERSDRGGRSDRGERSDRSDRNESRPRRSRRDDSRNSNVSNYNDDTGFTFGDALGNFFGDDENK